MPNRHIGCDVKIAALNLYEQGHLSIQQILACVGFLCSNFFRILHLWRTTGDAVRSHRRAGQFRILHNNNIDFLLRLIRQHPDYFLDELHELLKDNHFISVHYTAIHLELECGHVPNNSEGDCDGTQ
jgi:transposase